MIEKNEPLKYSVPDAQLGIILEDAPLFAPLFVAGYFT